MKPAKTLFFVSSEVRFLVFIRLLYHHLALVKAVSHNWNCWYITPDKEVKIATGTPLERVGKPEDVADVIAFLASEQARWITGQLIYVGGGWRMHQ